MLFSIGIFTVASELLNQSALLRERSLSHMATVQAAVLYHKVSGTDSNSSLGLEEGLTLYGSNGIRLAETYRTNKQDYSDGMDGKIKRTWRALHFADEVES